MQARLDGYLAAVADDPPIAEHALEFVRAAADRVLLAITSGAFRREIEHVLRAAGVRDLLHVVVSIDDVESGKARSGRVRSARSLSSTSLTGCDPPIEPWQAVAVEDATGGAQAARAAGMRVAAIRGSGYDAGERIRGRRDRAARPGALDQMLALGLTEEAPDGG